MSDQEKERSSRFPIAGVGASAGGLEACVELFEELQTPSGIGFVLVTLIEPNQQEHFRTTLGKATSLSVVQAEHGMRVEPDHIYILPSDAEMVIRDGSLEVSPRSGSANPNYPIDRFLESLAEEQESAALGIVLSGGGSDGAEGLRAIKTRGGTTFCQDPGTAKLSNMPRAAAATGAVDLVLAPADIARRLQTISFGQYLHQPETPVNDEVAGPDPLENRYFSRILSLLKNIRGVDFSHYKPNTISRRIGRRMLIHHVPSLGDYVKILETHPTETDDLYRDLLISVTSFFRETEMFEAFRGIITKSLESRKSGEPFRVWIAGCATGEEAYSLVITIAEIAEALGKRVPLQAFGTDISDDALNHARSGLFPQNIERNVSPERLRRFFTRVDAGYRISENIRQCCIFARHDLTSDPPFSHMDLITCRNVLIYLGSAIQDRIFRSVHYGLNTGGILILGSAETIGTRSDLFATLDPENKIFMKKPGPGRLGLEFNASLGASYDNSDYGSSALSARLPPSGNVDGRASRLLRDLYAPAGVLVTEDMRVLHAHGDTSFYLDTDQVDAGVNLMRLAQPDLLFPLRALLDRVRETRRSAAESNVKVSRDGETRKLTLRVIPLEDEPRSCLILFEERGNHIRDEPNSPSPQPPPDLQGATSQSQLSQAHHEVGRIREYLRKMTEQYEAATEELRAANEEARSANEELQSTNEELRTAKEELQSSNEELTTVNDELKQRNDEFRLANNDLTNVLSAATIPILMVGMDLRLRRFTPAAERLLGLGPTEIGQPLSTIQHGFELPDLGQRIRQAIEQLEVHHQRVQNRAGRWYEVFVRPYRTADDRIEGAVLSFIDVDELVRALQVAESARFFAEAIVETVQHPLLVLSADLRILRATDSFYRTFQVRREETEGRSLEDIGSGQWNFPQLRSLLDAALTRDVPFRDLEIEHDFAHLGRRTFRLNARRITSQDHDPHRLLLALEDVTERKETAELQYRRLFESARDAILIVDAKSGIVVDSNPYFTELTRYRKAEILGKRFPDLDAFLETQHARRLIAESISQGSVSYDSVQVRARDGKMLVLAIVANRYQLKEQDFIQVNIRDVTERRRMEDRLRRTNLDLQQFAFAASHDLQEPLRTITIYCQLLQMEHEGQLNEDARKHLDTIVGAADRISQMVLDLLGYSQVGRIDPKPEAVNVEAVLASAILNLQIAIRESKARITFDPLPTVEMDQTLLTQMLQNLIGNAIKYRSVAPPTIHISARHEGLEWIFSVKDNGIGLDPQYSEHIFTVFKRLHGKEYPGTGIGLAICKRIVERHEGRIWVESEEGKGATFFFTIPTEIRLEN